MLTRAAVSVRRPLVYGSSVAMVLVLTIGALVVSQRIAASSFDPSGARGVLHGVRRCLATEAPEAAIRLKPYVEIAERRSARHGQAPWWRRDEGSVESAWTEALIAAARALADSRTQRLAVRGRWAELEPVAAAELARAKVEAREAGLGRAEARRVQRAQLRLELAYRLAAAGAYTAAIRAGEECLEQALEVHTSWRALHRRFGEPESLKRWQAWIDAAMAEAARRGIKVVVVDKMRRRLHVYAPDRRRLASFGVELGTEGLRRKLRGGDGATPEGRYRVVEKRSGGQTRYYKALLLDYPNPEDRERFERERRRGAIPSGIGPGGWIEIHGHGGKGRDWTAGCIALRNDDMDRLFDLVSLRTLIVIVGTFGRDPDLEAPTQ